MASTSEQAPGEHGPTVCEMVLARSSDPGPGLITVERSWTHADVVAQAASRAAVLSTLRAPGYFHVAFLMDNTAEFIFWLQATALAGAVMVGGNPTHRGDELVRDLTHTESQILVVSSTYLGLLEGRELGTPVGTVHIDNPRVLVVDDESCRSKLAEMGKVDPYEVADPGIGPETLGYLIFTSGTSGAPKACRCTQGRMAGIGIRASQMFGLSPADVVYLAMPLFHSNALMAGWAPALGGASTVALPSGGRFSASGFLPDVRRFGVTFFNYVGKPLSYVLATPEQADDADNTLRLVFGNEAATGDVERFSTRFGCPVIDSYGSTEGGATVPRTPDTPSGALGPAPDDILVLNPDTAEPSAIAEFDEHGRLLNAEQAIGEMVSTTGGSGFEGYWRNDEAEKARLKQGWYWTGDLAYKDSRGYLHFAGRAQEWLRVDGENFAVAPVERILMRHPDVVLAAVYAVPDPAVGDQVMAALQLRPEVGEWDPHSFQTFLDGQEDLGSKWAPRFIRITSELPITATSKVMKRTLAAQRWHADDPIWWKPDRREPYHRLTADDVTRLDEAVGTRVA